MKTKHSMNNLGKLCAGIAAASFAAASIAETRYWASEAESASFNAVESWEPAPASMDEVANDTLVLNKGTDKVAVLESGDDFTVKEFYLGKDGVGGRLNVPAGKLTVSGSVSVGYSNCADTENIVNIIGGNFITKGGDNAPFRLGVSGKGTLSMSSGYMKSDHFYIGCGGEGSFEISGGTTEISGEWHIGRNSVGNVRVSGGASVSNGYAMYFGKNKGTGSLTIDSGSVYSHYSINFSGGEGVVNLNQGGVLKTMEFSGSGNGTFNWNGGVLSHDSTYYSSDIIPASTANLKVNVGEYGAIYESEAADRQNDEISHPLSGVGALVKRGGGKLTVTGALDVKGGIKVEGGTLKVANLARTVFKELSVAANTTLELDLGGRTVTVEKYVLNGEEKGAGTYSAFNGTIRVLSAEEKVPASAVWTNAAGDNDVTNPDNWAVKNAAGDELLSFTAPGADTPVFIPVGSDAALFSGFADVTWVLDQNLGYKVPAVVENDAAVWYDPSDVDTLTIVDNAVTEIRNKGTIKVDADSGVNLDLQPRTTGKSAPSLSNGGFNGQQALYFGEQANTFSGYKSKGNFPADFPSNGGRTMFVVAQGNVNNMIMLMISQGASNTEEGRSLLQAYKGDNNYGTGYKIGLSNSGGTGWSGAKATFDSVVTGKSYIFAGRTTCLDDAARVVRSYAIDAAGGDAGSVLNCSMLPSSQGIRFNIYYGSFELTAYGQYKDTNGYQGEALIFTKALTDDEMTAVNDYLKAKWLSPKVAMPSVDKLAISANAYLDGATCTYGNISGNGSFEDGTVVLNGDLEITVNANGSVVAPSFDKLVLGSTARLVVKGAGNLPKNTVGLQVVQFNSLEGEFSAIVNDTGDKVSVAYTESGVNAMRTPGAMLLIR